MAMTLEFYRSRVNEPYLMGYFASSKVNVVNDGSGILPRLEINAVDMGNSMLFLQAVQMFLGTGRVTGTPAAALMLIEDPGALRTVLQKYVLPDPFGMKKPAALKALKTLKSAAANAGAAASSSNSTPGRGGSSGSSSTQHAPSAAASTADDTPRSSDGGVGTNATLAAGSAAAADPQNRDQHERICASCGAKGEKRCSVCRTTWYCGKDCQKADWAEHKKSCKPSA